MAPTSTPRVGSSKMIRSRLLDQTLADHDLLLVAAGQFDDAGIVVDRLDVERARSIAPAERRISARLTTAGFLAARRRAGRRIEILGDRHRLEEALALAVLGDVDDAVAHRLAPARGSAPAGPSSSISPPRRKSRL